MPPPNVLTGVIRSTSRKLRLNHRSPASGRENSPSRNRDGSDSTPRTPAPILRHGVLGSATSRVNMTARLQADLPPIPRSPSADVSAAFDPRSPLHRPSTPTWCPPEAVEDVGDMVRAEEEIARDEDVGQEEPEDDMDANEAMDQYDDETDDYSDPYSISNVHRSFDLEEYDMIDADDDDEDDEDSDAEVTARIDNHIETSLKSFYGPDVLAPTPGPLQFAKLLFKGKLSETYVVRDCSASQLPSGRLICVKVLNKAQLRTLRVVHHAFMEFDAYKIIARCEPGQLRGLDFLMQSDGTLQDESSVYFFTELMHCDLFEMLVSKLEFCRLNAQLWIAQIIMGLNALHNLGIIHRDIKPENLLIDSRGNMRITDFGTSYIHPSAPVFLDLGYCDEIAGTCEYMAPEIAVMDTQHRQDRRKYGPMVDYWALGCVAFDLECPILSHKTLFRGMEDVVWFAESTFTEEEFIEREGVTDPLAKKLIAGLLRRNPDDRFDASVLSELDYFNDRETNKLIFADLSDGARSRTRPIHYQPEDPGRLDVANADIRFLTAERREHPDPDDRAFEDLRWINPWGAWAS